MDFTKWFTICFLFIHVKVAFPQIGSSSTDISTQSDVVYGIDSSQTSFLDTRDNQVYAFVRIADKLWMSENLNYKTPNSLAYNNKSQNAEIYGRLYNIEDAKCSCPDGWRLPSEKEWQDLELYLGIGTLTLDSIGWRGKPYGDILKSHEREAWGGVDYILPSETGFNAIAGGIAYDSNYFANINIGGYFWSATMYYSSFAWSRYLSYDKDQIFRNISMVNWFLSVRCVKDAINQ